MSFFWRKDPIMLHATTQSRWLALLLLAAFLPSLHGGEKSQPLKGQVKVGTHALKMDSGKLYQIIVAGEGFRPMVSIRPGFFQVQNQLDRGDTFEAFFVPQETKEYRLFVLPDLYDDELGVGPLDYTVNLKNIPLEEKALVKEEAKLTAEDPIYKSKDAVFQRDTHFKAYPVTMKAKQFYIIDMVRSTDNFDPYLFLEDSEGKVVSSNDDGGGNLNSRIIFQPRRDGDYRVIATTLSRATGPFSLTVRTQAKE
jgi:hypothetical protein